MFHVTVRKLAVVGRARASQPEGPSLEGVLTRYPTVGRPLALYSGSGGMRTSPIRRVTPGKIDRTLLVETANSVYEVVLHEPVDREERALG